MPAEVCARCRYEAFSHSLGPERREKMCARMSDISSEPDPLCEAPGDRQGVEGASPLRWRSSDRHRPRVMRSCSWGLRRSVDRGTHRPAIEPRKSPILGADAVHKAEGNISGRVIASARMTRRGQRPWHVQTLLAREPGDLAIDRSATAGGPHREGEEP